MNSLKSDLFRPALALLLGLVLLLVLTACGGGPGGGGGGGEDRGVVITPDPLSLEVGETATLTAVVAGGEGSQDVDWSSSDAGVATVDAAGLLVAHAAGTAVITAVSQADTGLSGTAAVTVTEPLCLTPVLLDEPLAADTVLERQDHAAGCTDYVVRGMLDVAKSLSIGAGVTMDFDIGSGFFLSPAQGSLAVVGTEEQPVTLRGLEGAAGAWRGLVFASASSDNSLEHVVISGTGAPVTNAVYPFELRASVIVPIGHRVSISDTWFKGGAGHGLWLAADAELPAFSGNRFQGHAFSPIALDLTQLRHLDGSNVLAGPEDDPNGSELIQLIDRPVAAGTTVSVTDRGLPYLLGAAYGTDNDYAISGATLTIGPGAVIFVDEGIGITVEDDGAGVPGTLLIQGTAAAGVTMLPAAETAADDWWDGIAILSGGANSIAHLDIGHGGGRTNLSVPDNTGANVMVVGPAALDISDSHLHDAPMCLERIDAGGMPPVVNGSGNTGSHCIATDLP